MDSTKHKLCKGCNTTFEVNGDNFFANGYTPIGTKKWKALCKSCHTNNRANNFEMIVSSMFLVYECCVCKYNKCKAAIDFHHVSPENKLLGISRFRCGNYTKDKVIAELQKCIMLCSNCHREHHAGMLDISSYGTVGKWPNPPACKAGNTNAHVRIDASTTI